MKDLTYKIVRSPKRKKLTITIERDRAVVVHAPESTSNETVSRLVNAKRQWIFEKLHHAQKYQNRAHPPGKEVVNGSLLLFLGTIIKLRLLRHGVGRLSSPKYSRCLFRKRARSVKH